LIGRSPKRQQCCEGIVWRRNISLVYDVFAILGAAMLIPVPKYNNGTFFPSKFHCSPQNYCRLQFVANKALGKIIWRFEIFLRHRRS
jgi:hypothetical protein